MRYVVYSQALRLVFGARSFCANGLVRLDPADERLSYMALSLLARAVAETRRVLFVPVGAGSSAPPFDKWAKLCAMLRLAFLPFPNSTWFTLSLIHI